MKYFTIALIALLLIIISVNSSLADVGIIVALNSNLEQLKENIKIKRISKKAGREFFSGQIDNIDVVLVRSPMGKVNNAITAQALISHDSVKSVVSIGPAGAIDKRLNIGDAIVATEVYQHDFGTFKPYGFLWGRVSDGTSWDEPGYTLADKGLRELALLCAKDRSKSQNRIIEGVIVTGDQFISSQDKKEWLFKKFRAMAVDMGAASIAQVCYANRVPYCILRIITDKATVDARTDFENSIPFYQTDIDILGFVKGILQGIQNRR